MPEKPNDQPDVYLNVPDVHVDRLASTWTASTPGSRCERLANLLDLRAGVDVAIANVSLDIQGVSARAMLKVRLENVFAILDRALTSLDRNPQLIEGVMHTADDAIEGSRGRCRPSSPTAHSRSALTRCPDRTSGGPRVTRVATAAGLLSGAAIAAHGNGGVQKTLKELTA